MTHLIGQTIGQYRVIEQVGQGGMATVYKAFQPSMERNVALKVLPAQLAQDPTFIQRFRQEAKAIAQLEHPHILPVYDYGEENGLTYMVMRYMDNGILTDRLNNKSINMTEIVHLLGQVAEALDYTHSQGIVHRDIKPSNVLLDPRGEALLTDFGVAKIVEGATGLTREGIIGTPKYMSPEQAQGKPVDNRSDIYSLGIILYEALVGKVPFEAETPVAVLMKHVSEPLPLPRAVKPDISEAMEQVVLKSLTKNPADRYQTAKEMKQAMDAALAAAGQGLTQFSPIPATSSNPPRTVSTPSPNTDSPIETSRSNRLPVIIGGGLLAIICAVIAIGGGFFLNSTSNDTSAIAVTETATAGEAALSETTEVSPTNSETETSAEITNTPSSIPTETRPSVAEETIVTAETDTPSSVAGNTPTPAEPTATPTAAPTIAPALPPTPTPVEALAAINVTGNPGKSDNPRLLFDSENILHLVWFDNSRQGDNLGDFLHRQRTPDGEWTAAEFLTDDLDSSVGWADTGLKLARHSAGHICVFWEGHRGSGGLGTVGLYMRCQADGVWSDAAMVREFGGGATQRRDFQPLFTTDGTLKTVCIAEIHNIYFEDIQLSDGFKTTLDPAFAIDAAGGYHAVWVRQGDPFSVEYRYSNDSGQTWQEAERLTDDETRPVGGGSPTMVADGQGNVHLIWKGSGVRYRRWTPDSGWEPTIELTRGESRDNSTTLGLAVDSNDLAHVVWQGLDGAFYTEQLSTETWSQPRLIADTLNTGVGPDVAVDGQGGRHFVWQVEDDAVDLYYATLP